MRGESYAKASRSTVRPKPALEAALVRRRGVHQFALPVAVRPHRKIFMPAGFAAIGGDRQPPPQERKGAVHIFAGDALQHRIAADGTMRVHQLSKRHQSGVEPLFAMPASPWIHTNSAIQVVNRVLAARTARVFAFTSWADHLTACGPLGILVCKG